MKRLLLIPVLALAALALAPSPAAADATAFYGVATTTVSRPATGLAIAVKILLVGIEFEYAHMDERNPQQVPGLNTSMFNLVLATPTKVKVYFTTGGGLAHQTLGSASEWTFGTNIGGGVKFPLAGPLGLRIDYRIFKVHGALPGSVDKRQHRIYGGMNFAF
jgi:opacity protein-like surface antigen